MENLERYFKILYPNYEELSDHDKYFANLDRGLLEEKYYEIESKIAGMVDFDRKNGKDVSVKNTFLIVFRGIKADRCFKVLHPNIGGSGQHIARDDYRFIFDHIDEINREFETLIGNITYLRREDPNEQECMRQAIEIVKAREEQRNQSQRDDER